jgi:hypothetical protein
MLAGVDAPEGRPDHNPAAPQPGGLQEALSAAHG